MKIYVKRQGIENMVNEAVILAGGLGTRMMPANFYCPKEFLPLLGIPLIHHLIWEATTAGIEEIHIVSSPEKEVYVERLVEGRLEIGEIRTEIIRHHLSPIPSNVKCNIHIQEEPLGVGDAISLASEGISEPFLVMLGDNAMVGEGAYSDIGPDTGCMASKIMVQRFEQTGSPCVGAICVSPSSVSKYGMIDFEEGIFRGVVEKPKLGSEPSRLALCGRYIFPANSSKLLGEVRDGERLELQSIHFLNHLAEIGDVEVVELDNIEWVDAGNIESWNKSENLLFNRNQTWKESHL